MYNKDKSPRKVTTKKEENICVYSGHYVYTRVAHALRWTNFSHIWLGDPFLLWVTPICWSE
jgi:hypothetical protein